MQLYLLQHAGAADPAGERPPTHLRPPVPRPARPPGNRRDTTSLLDRVDDHAKSLARRIGKDDRRTLDQYLTAVRETEKKIETLEHGSGVQANFDSFQRPGTPRNLNEQVDRLLDVVALGASGRTRTARLYMLGNDNSRMIFDFLGVRKEHHYLSHYFRNFSRANLEDLYKVCLWHTEKFAYLIRRLNAYADGEGRLLDNTLVLFGAGMGESERTRASGFPPYWPGDRPPQDGAVRPPRSAYGTRPPPPRFARHVRCRRAAPAPGRAVRPLAGLDGGAFRPYQEVPFESLVEVNEDKVTVQGRLRFSHDLDQANQFFIDVKGEPQPVRLQVPFKTFERHNLPYFCGSPVRIVGTGMRKGNEIVVTQVSELGSLIGLKPG